MITDTDRQAARDWFKLAYPWHESRANRNPESSSRVWRDQIVAAFLAGMEVGRRDGAKLADNFQEIRPPGLPSV